MSHAAWLWSNACASALAKSSSAAKANRLIGISSMVFMALRRCLVVRFLVHMRRRDLGKDARKSPGATPPVVECLDESHLAARHLLALPDARRVLVRLRERRIGVDGAEDLVHAEAVAHRRDELGEDVPGMLARDRHA